MTSITTCLNETFSCNDIINCLNLLCKTTNKKSGYDKFHILFILLLCYFVITILIPICYYGYKIIITYTRRLDYINI